MSKCCGGKMELIEEFEYAIWRCPRCGRETPYYEKCSPKETFIRILIMLLLPFMVLGSLVLYGIALINDR